jgi:hypothetical protein
MGFLVLAIMAITTSDVQGHYSVGTLAGLLVGVVGAGICSVRGLQSDWMPRREDPHAEDPPSDP